MPAMPSGAGANRTPHAASCATDGIMISCASGELMMEARFTPLSRASTSVKAMNFPSSGAIADSSGTLRMIIPGRLEAALIGLEMRFFLINRTGATSKLDTCMHAIFTLS